MSLPLPEQQQLEPSLPASVAQLVWRGDEMGGRETAVVSSGFKPLDRQLPGGGWPHRSLTELLQSADAHCEWRLLAPSLSRIQKKGGTVFLVGSPQVPHLPGLRAMGIDERRLVWIDVQTARDRLWATQQILQSGQAGAVMAWLPQADARALRRLQACTHDCDAPVFVIRPQAMHDHSSPAPLRVEVGLAEAPWTLRLRIVKRRGPPLDDAIELPSVPGGLTQVLAKRAASLASAVRVQPAASPAQAKPGRSPAPTHAIPFPARSPQESLDESLAGAVLPTLARVAG